MPEPCSPWPPPRRRLPLHVAIPGSILSTEHDLREKTLKAGIVARALTDYRVDLVVVYRDPDTSPGDLRLLKTLLEYAMTPPHLRRMLVPLRPELRYAAVMPPVQTPRHLPPREPEPGAVLDGLVLERRGGSCRVWLGSLGTATLPRCRARRGDVVTVKIAGVDPLRLEPASWDGVYTGYTVVEAGAAEEAVARARARGLAVVATSRLGSCEAAKAIPRSRGVMLVFGGPHRGLLEYTDPQAYDLVINTVPIQGNATVRTEEALHATLAIINYLAESGECGGR